MISQFGFSLIIPILIPLWVASYLKTKFELGGWIFFVALAIGLFSAYSCLASFFSYVLRESEKSGKDWKTH